MSGWYRNPLHLIALSGGSYQTLAYAARYAHPFTAVLQSCKDAYIYTTVLQSRPLSITLQISHSNTSRAVSKVALPHPYTALPLQSCTIECYNLLAPQASLSSHGAQNATVQAHPSASEPGRGSAAMRRCDSRRRERRAGGISTVHSWSSRASFRFFGWPLRASTVA